MRLFLLLRLLSAEKLRNKICPNKEISTKDEGQAKFFEKYVFFIFSILITCLFDFYRKIKFQIDFLVFC